MNSFRTGDEVLFETPAKVVGTVTGNMVRVRFGEIEIDVDPVALLMVKRSLHIGDAVMHKGDKGTITHMLEETVFLVSIDGATGTDAYRVVELSDEIHHVDAAAAKTAGDAEREGNDHNDAPSHAEPLELTERLPSDASDEAHENNDHSTGIAAMAATLSDVLSQESPRRAALDLEQLGHTETVKDVRNAQGDSADEA